MTKYLIGYFGILITYLILDGLWLGVVSKAHYQQAIGQLLRDQYPMWPWITFYVMYSACALYLVVLPRADQPSMMSVALAGAVMGVAAYGAYNLTCYAILKSWPLNITLMDWAWGTFITATTSVAGWKAMRLYMTP